MEATPNNNKSRANSGRPNIQPIVTGASIKPERGKKLIKSVIGQDLDSAADHLMKDVLGPSIKNLMSNFFHSCVDTFLGTSGYSGMYTQNNNQQSRVYRNYNTVSSRPQGLAYANQRSSYAQSFTYDIDTLTFAPESLGWDILKQMDDIIDEYGHVTVGTFYEFFRDENGNEIIAPPQAHNYGWKHLRTASVEPVGGGRYCLRMPTIVPIGRD